MTSSISKQKTKNGKKKAKTGDREVTARFQAALAKSLPVRFEVLHSGYFWQTFLPFCDLPAQSIATQLDKEIHTIILDKTYAGVEQFLLDWRSATLLDRTFDNVARRWMKEEKVFGTENPAYERVWPRWQQRVAKSIAQLRQRPMIQQSANQFEWKESSLDDPTGLLIYVATFQDHFAREKHGTRSLVVKELRASAFLTDPGALMLLHLVAPRLETLELSLFDPHYKNRDDLTGHFQSFEYDGKNQHANQALTAAFNGPHLTKLILKGGFESEALRQILPVVGQNQKSDREFWARFTDVSIPNYTNFIPRVPMMLLETLDIGLVNDFQAVEFWPSLQTHCPNLKRLLVKVTDIQISPRHEVALVKWLASASPRLIQLSVNKSWNIHSPLDDALLLKKSVFSRNTPKREKVWIKYGLGTIVDEQQLDQLLHDVFDTIGFPDENPEARILERVAAVRRACLQHIALRQRYSLLWNTLLHCRKLEHLEFDISPLSVIASADEKEKDPDLESIPVTQDAKLFQWITQRQLPRLMDLFGSLQNLQILKTTNSLSSEAAFAAISRYGPNIRNIKFAACKPWFPGDDVDPLFDPKRPETLEAFKKVYAQCESFPGDSIYGLRFPLSSMKQYQVDTPRLRELLRLELREWLLDEHQWVCSHLFPRLSQLRRFETSSSGLVEMKSLDELLLSLATNCPLLQYIEVHATELFETKTFQFLVDKLPDLETLILTVRKDARRASPVIPLKIDNILHALTRCPRLRILDFDNSLYGAHVMPLDISSEEARKQLRYQNRLVRFWARDTSPGSGPRFVTTVNIQ